MFDCQCPSKGNSAVALLCLSLGNRQSGSTVQCCLRGGAHGATELELRAPSTSSASNRAVYELHEPSTSSTSHLRAQRAADELREPSASRLGYQRACEPRTGRASCQSAPRAVVSHLQLQPDRTQLGNCVDDVVCAVRSRWLLQRVRE